MSKTVRVTQIRGTQQTSKAQKATLKALGLYSIGSSNDIQDSTSLRGMLNAVHHMVKAEVVEGKAATKKATHKGYTLG